MSENSESRASAFEVMTFASPLGLISGLLDNFSRSEEPDASQVER
jgi:hypothetical protein